MFSDVNVFNIEKPIFIRERLSNTYCTSAYYFARSLAYFPEEVILPLILVSICYFLVNLNTSFEAFMWTYFAIFLVSWSSSSFAIFISAIAPNPQIAYALIPSLTIPFLLVGGLFIPSSNIPEMFKFLEYLSIFRYGY